MKNVLRAAAFVASLICFAQPSIADPAECQNAISEYNSAYQTLRLLSDDIQTASVRARAMTTAQANSVD